VDALVVLPSPPERRTHAGRRLRGRRHDPRSS
jgi:hypothetical protein